VDVCSLVLSSQVLNAAAYRGPSVSKTYLVLKASGDTAGEPGHSQAGEREAKRLIGGENLPVYDHRNRGRCVDVDYSWIWFFLSYWSILFTQEWWGHIRYEVYRFPSRLLLV
jgi:hypothetical protein